MYNNIDWYLENFRSSKSSKVHTEMYELFMRLLFCKKDNKFVIEYCSDERINVREYELI